MIVFYYLVIGQEVYLQLKQMGIVYVDNLKITVKVIQQYFTVIKLSFQECLTTKLKVLGAVEFSYNF